jgi:toxin-antitoxin system PIN domain toxin
MKPGLLDVNVLIALIDSGHEFHIAAHKWFKHNRKYGWATCPITENGCLRIMSKPGYPFPGLTVNRVREIMAELVNAEGHLFWPDSISLLEARRCDLTVGRAKHLTDLYLLTLAREYSGQLVTFDRTIPWSAVRGCAIHDLEVLSG